ncbi:MAG TPA: hotdog domain-containing protein [Bryobacteraceae bacterium]|nr:hotdog domain-containing protein [Bryobacteraceae bacterium]
MIREVEMTEIPIGAIRTEDHVVADEDVITFLGAGNARVLSTPRMILFMERTCRNMMAEVLGQGFSTVGMHVNIWHVAAAKEGSAVTYKAELLKCTSRRCEFRVEARCGDKLIGEGTHLRAIIDTSRFAKA